MCVRVCELLNVQPHPREFDARFGSLHLVH